MHTHTHTHKYTHTHVHKYTQCTKTHTCTYTRMYIHARKHTHTYKTHNTVHTHTHTCTQIHTHTLTQMYTVHTNTHMYIHTHACKHTHTHSHTHTFTHTHTLACQNDLIAISQKLACDAMTKVQRFGPFPAQLQQAAVGVRRLEKNPKAFKPTSEKKKKNHLRQFCTAASENQSVFHPTINCRATTDSPANQHLLPLSAPAVGSCGRRN